MPALVTHTVPASSVAKGDLYRDKTVESRKTATKWTIIEFTDGSTRLRTENDAQLQVERMEATPEEKAQAKLDFQLQALDRAEQGASAELAKAQAKIREYLDKDYQLGYSETGDLFAAQANACLWYRVTQTARSAAQHAVEFDETTGTWSVLDAYSDGQPIFTRLDALNDVRDEVKTELLEYASFTSRSTSVLSNAIENYEREVKAKFVSRRGWYWMA